MKSFKQYLMYELNTAQSATLKRVIDGIENIVFGNTHGHTDADVTRKLIGVAPVSGYSDTDTELEAGKKPKSHKRHQRNTYFGTDKLQELMGYIQHAHGVKLKTLGFGAFSVAASGNTEKYVVKFTKDMTDFNFINGIYRTRAWEKNNLFPAYYYVKKIDDYLFVSVMEYIDNKRAVEAADDLGVSTWFSALMMHVSDSVQQRESVEDSEQSARAYESNCMNAMDELGVPYSKIYDYVVKINEIFGRPIRRWDLHSGNWGIRNDGSVVFFDPIAGIDAGSLAGKA